MPASLIVALPGGQRTLRRAVAYGAASGPRLLGLTSRRHRARVITLRASSYRLQVSSNASAWRTVATVAGRTSGTLDVLRFKAVRARFVRLAIAAATGGDTRWSRS